MLFFDECIPRDVTHALQTLQVPVTDVRLEGLQEASDAEVAARARVLSATFVTYDIDFTSTLALVEQLARLDVCVVLIRKTKVKGPSSAIHLPETAYLILRHCLSDWPRRCAEETGILSASMSGTRFRPWSKMPILGQHRGRSAMT